MNLVAVMLGAALLAAAGDDDQALGLTDLPGYHEALRPESGKVSEQAPLVGFRDLWDRPEAYRGRRVRVEGRIVRRFHQPPTGSFPALVELWMTSPAGDPFCLVFPDSAQKTAPALGTRVRFAGTFLKRLRYEGSDGPRLAPLVVGPNAPEVVSAQPVSTGSGLPSGLGSRLDWVVGLVVGLMVAATLITMHLRRPLPRRRDVGPPPVFDDQAPAAGEHDER